MKTIVRTAGIAVASLVLAVTVAGDARANERHAYCNEYAHNTAKHETGGNALGGAIGGAATGAIIGGILEGGGGAGAGAIIGGGAGLLFGAIGERHRYERVYERAYEDCMEEYRQPSHDSNAASYDPDDGYAPPPPPETTAYKPEPWSDEWYAYCREKYRSFDPDTGYYLAYSGRYRFCR